jgi:WD40 repeat protein
MPGLLWARFVEVQMGARYAALSGAVLLLFLVAPPTAEAQGPPPFSSEESSSNYAFCLSRDGKRLALGYATGWSIWGVAGRRRVCIGKTGCAHALAFSADGLLLAVGSDGGQLKVFDALAGLLLWDLTRKGHIAGISHLEFTPDKRFLISKGGDGMLRIWDVRARKPHIVFRYTGKWDSVDTWRALPPDWPAEQAKVITVPGVVSTIGNFAVSPDSKHLAVPLGPFEVKVYELTTGNVVKTFRTAQDTPFSACYSADGKLLALGGACEKGTIEVWDVAKGKRLTTLKGHTYSVLHMAFSPDNGTILSAGLADGARVWDVKTGRQKYAYHQAKVGFFENRVVGVAFLPDGKTFVTLPHHPYGSPVYFWDTATGKEGVPPRWEPAGGAK